MKRSIRKISPSQKSSFDDQFWPVLVAITVLSGIALGAIFTLFRGPWMWGSLLVLPLFAAAAIVFLFRLDNSRLRRSLQFAIICSLAAHLLVMVFASVVNIFQNPFQPKQPEVAQQEVRTIHISDQRTNFVWEEPNQRETPEPKVEQEKKKTPTTDVKPQPTPVKEVQPTVQPKIVKREKPVETVPRQDRELSKLQRQKSNSQPKSSQPTESQQAAKSQPTKSTEQAQPASSSKAESVTRQSSQSREQISETKPTESKPTESKPEPQVTRAQPRRAETAERAVESLPKPSPSEATVRRSSPKIPKASQSVPVTERVARATSRRPVEATPAKASDSITKREVKRSVTRPTVSDISQPTKSPRPQVARTTQRRERRPTPPTISTEASTRITPRRATAQAPTAVSPVALEQPSRSPESQTASRELKSKTLSVNRSTAGVVGIGKSQNLDRFVGGEPSPARQASDSAKRERTQSSRADAQMLVSSNRAELRRSTAKSATPTSAFKATTTESAKIAGSNTPSTESLESSAARLTSASNMMRDTISAEQGSANIDLGPTKVVRDRATDRRSGGGQPEVAQTNPEQTKRSRDRSNTQPTLVAEVGVDVAAPSSQSAQPATSNAPEVDSRNVAVAKAGGDREMTLESWSSDTVGELADAGLEKLASDTSDARQRANYESSENAWDEEEEEDEDEKNSRGSVRTRVAQTPITNSDIGFGIAENKGRSSQESPEGNSPAESLAADLTRKATATVTGSGIGPTVTNAMLQAATSLPVISSSRGSNPGNVRSKEPESIEGIAGNRRIPSARNPSRSMPKSSGAGSGIGELIAAKSPSQPGDAMSVEAVEATVERSDVTSKSQIQGAALDVLAPDGPAGLGIKPSERIGVMTRPASKESLQIQPDLKSRFRKSDYGGLPSINPDAVVAEEAFQSRSPSSLSRSVEPTTEAAIQLGLEFLAKHQSPDGSWTLTKFDREETQHISQLDSDTAATGLALLAFQGAGYNHREFKYARQIDHALQWLIENQSEDGGLYVPSDKKSNSACRLYSHGIAALALTEAYGMTQDVRLKEPAQMAIRYIESSQDERKGGWRYFDQPGLKSSDTSVSGWMMMALQSGRLAGLDVKKSTFDGVDDWLDVAVDPNQGSLFRYNPYAVDSKGVSRVQGRQASPSMTSVGLLMKIYSGWDKSDPRLIAGADYLLSSQLPGDNTPVQRDTYYWYYATQVIKHVGGDRWERWNGQLRPMLIRSQEKTGEMAGSWHPYKPVPDRWGAFGGRLYVTTMNLLSLEVRHRMLPLYRQGEPTVEGVVFMGDEEDDADQPEKSRSQNNRNSDDDQSSRSPIQKQETPPTRIAVRKPPVPDFEREAPTSISIQWDAQGFEPVSLKLDLEELPEWGGQARNGLSSHVEPIENSPPGLKNTKPSAEQGSLESRTGPDQTRKVPQRPAIADKQPSLRRPLQGAELRPTPITQSGANADFAKPTRHVAVEVSGSITLDGQPLKNALVELIPDLGSKPIAVRTNDQGQFSLSPNMTQNSGVVPGPYRVAITTFIESPDESMIDFLETIPAKYNVETTLRIDVGADKLNNYSFKLTSE